MITNIIIYRRNNNDTFMFKNVMIINDSKAV